MVSDLQMSGVIPGNANNAQAAWQGFDDKGGWFDKPSYKGAFDPSGADMWHEGWTLTHEAGVIQ